MLETPFCHRVMWQASRALVLEAPSKRSSSAPPELQHHSLEEQNDPAPQSVLQHVIKGAAVQGKERSSGVSCVRHSWAQIHDSFGGCSLCKEKAAAPHLQPRGCVTGRRVTSCSQTPVPQRFTISGLPYLRIFSTVLCFRFGPWLINGPTLWN